MHQLLGKVVPLVIDDALHILEVDVALNNNQHIVGVASIGKNNFADILAITPNKYSLLIVMLLLGHQFLIVAGLVKMLDAVTELIAHVTTAFAQIKHLYRCDADAGLGQSG